MLKNTAKIGVFSLILALFSVLLAGSATAFSYDVGEMLGYWNFDQESGDFTDTLTGAFNATPFSVTQGVPGLIVRAGDFLDGGSAAQISNVSLSKALTGYNTTGFTWSVWFNQSSISPDPSESVLIQRKNIAPLIFQYRLRLRSSGGVNSVQFLMRDDSNINFNVIAPFEYNDSAFHHVVTTFNRSKLTIFIDGVEAASNDTWTGDMVDFGGTQNWSFGDTGDGLGAVIDEAVFFNVTLTDAEITDLFNGGAGSTFPNFRFVDESFNAEAFSDSQESFVSTVILDLDNLANINGFVFYNGTRHPMSTSQTSETRNYTGTFSVPQVNVSTNFSFFFQYNVTDTLGINETFTSDTFFQLVKPLTPITVGTACAPGFFPAVNFTSFEESNLTILNTSVEFNIVYGVTNLTSNIEAGSFDSVNNFFICVNETVNVYKSGLSEIAYGDGDFVEKRFYVFEDFAFSNSTTVDFVLHNLDGLSATSFLIRVKETTLIPLKNVIVSLLRWYPDRDEYRTVEMSRTDDDGETVFKAVEEDIDYRMAVNHINGSLITIIDPTRMVCLVDPCTFDIFVIDDLTFDVFLGIDVNLTFNDDSEAFTLIYNDPSEETTTMTLEVFRDGSTGSTSVCSTSSNNFIGVLSCSVAGMTGTFRSVVTREASPPIILETLTVILRNEINDLEGGNIILWAAFLVGALGALIGGFLSPILALVFAAVALIPIWAFGGITLSMLTSVLIIFIVVVHFIRRAGSDES